MIQIHFLGATVGFDIALCPEVVEFTFQMNFKYFENRFIAKAPVTRGGRHGAEHIVRREVMETRTARFE